MLSSHLLPFAVRLVNQSLHFQGIQVACSLWITMFPTVGVGTGGLEGAGGRRTTYSVHSTERHKRKGCACFTHNEHIFLLRCGEVLHGADGKK